MKKGFTLVEMIVVVIVLAIMISMVPFRMQSLQAHTKFSLSMNDREDFWQKTVNRMRQSNHYKEAIITVNASGATTLYSGTTDSGAGLQAVHLFPEGTVINTTGDMSWKLGSYGIACPGYASGFQITLGKNSMCYSVDTNSCNLLKISCKLP